MTLEDVPLTPSDEPLPDDIAAIVVEADERIDRFFVGHRGEPAIGFVPSDFLLAYRFLRAIDDGGLAPGGAFCEWGSGFGVVATLAATCGFDAVGIEINGELVEQAERLAEDFEVPVEFAHGSFLPVGADALTDTVADSAWLALGGADAYDELGRDVEDFDVIFAYPWPGEERVIEDVFDAYAAAGALLVTYHGIEGMRVRRRIADCGLRTAD